MFRSLHQTLSRGDLAFGCFCCLLAIKATWIEKNPDQENIADQFNRLLWYFCIGVILNSIATRVLQSSVFKGENKRESIRRTYKLKTSDIKFFLHDVSLNRPENLQLFFQNLYSLEYTRGLIKYFYAYLEECAVAHLRNQTLEGPESVCDANGKFDYTKIANKFLNFRGVTNLDNVMRYIKQQEIRISNKKLKSFIHTCRKTYGTVAVLELLSARKIPAEIAENIALYLSLSDVTNVLLVQKEIAKKANIEFNLNLNKFIKTVQKQDLDLYPTTRKFIQGI